MTREEKQTIKAFAQSEEISHNQVTQKRCIILSSCFAYQTKAAPEVYAVHSGW